MLNWKEIFIILITWIILFLIYYFILLSRLISIHEGFIISFVGSALLKSLYDIKNRTGNTKMYVYSEVTNQKLRYLVLFVSFIIFLLYHYALFCIKLQYCIK